MRGMSGKDSFSCQSGGENPEKKMLPSGPVRDLIDLGEKGVKSETGRKSVSIDGLREDKDAWDMLVGLGRGTKKLLCGRVLKLDVRQ